MVRSNVDYLTNTADCRVAPNPPSGRSHQRTFLSIIKTGLDETEQVPPRLDLAVSMPGFAEDQAPYAPETERHRIQQMTSRIVRDRIFRRIVLRAYDERCAITGLKFINGGGRAEVDAAHIRPVQHDGPDTINNGIALCGTAHWMFDRGLIGLSDSFEIIISRQINDIDSVRAFVNDNGKANVPTRQADWPHPRFLGWHRNNCFKG